MGGRGSNCLVKKIGKGWGEDEVEEGDGRREMGWIR